MHHKKTVKKYYEKETWYHLIPIMFLIAIVPLIVYLKVLSTIFSHYTEVAKWGFVDRYEGMYVLLSYMVFFFAAIYF